MALDNITKIISAGFEQGQVALLDSSGFPMGLAGALTAGSSTGLYEVLGVQTANIAIPTPEKTTVMGNNRVQGVFLWKPSDTPEFDLDVAVADTDLAAAVESVKVRDLDKWALHPLGGGDAVYKDCMFLCTTHAQSKEDGSDGLSLWYHLLIPKLQLAYVGPQGVNMRNENVHRFHAIVRPTKSYPWGEALSADNEGTRDAMMFDWTSENPVTLDTISLEAATAEITLARTPAMDTVTAGSGILFYIDGVETALTGVTPSTKVATFGAPGDTGTGVVVYEYVA